MRAIDLSVAKGAIFSEDRRFRYALWRLWSNTRPFLLMVGLNPSKAEEYKDDSTVTRGIVRADRSGFGGFLMANLYAYVSTDPEALLGNGDTESSPFVGELTDHYLREMIALSQRHLCGWGSFSPVANRAPCVLEMIQEPYCLGVNKDGQPKHPLYIGYDVAMVQYPLTK